MIEAGTRILIVDGDAARAERLARALVVPEADVPKPFTVRLLAEKVRSVLDA